MGPHCSSFHRMEANSRARGGIFGAGITSSGFGMSLKARRFFHSRATALPFHPSRFRRMEIPSPPPARMASFIFGKEAREGTCSGLKEIAVGGVKFHFQAMDS